MLKQFQIGIIISIFCNPFQYHYSLLKETYAFIPGPDKTSHNSNPYVSKTVTKTKRIEQKPCLYNAKDRNHISTQLHANANHDPSSNDKVTQNRANMKENKRDKKEDESSKIDWLVVVIQDRDLLAGDLLTLTLTAQLLGFTDAIQDPTFLPNGGFMAPVPMIPNTLNTLITRLSIMDIAWVLASIKSKGYSVEAIADDMSALKCGLTIWLDHCSVRIVIALLLAISSHSQVDGMDLLRQVWFTLPIMLVFRIIYGRSRTGRF